MFGRNATTPQTGATKAFRTAFPALALGVAVFDFFPLLAILEIAVALLLTRTSRREVAALTLFPTFGILASAISVMASVSGFNNPLMLGVSVSSSLVAALLVATPRTLPGNHVPKRLSRGIVERGSSRLPNNP